MNTLRLLAALVGTLGFVVTVSAQLVNDGASVTLANVTTNITGSVTVGTNGSFTLLTLSDNALLTNSANGVIGRNSTAKSNEVRLVSSTARWQMGGTLFVGSNGAANRLVVSNGALVESGSGSFAFRVESSNNTALVTGPGSVWSNRFGLDIGGLGRGNQLIVSNGGAVFSRAARLGVEASSSSNLAVVTGAGSVWSNTTSLSVGNIGPGNRLVIEAGGRVVSDTGVVGDFNSASNNLALVTGPGSLWTNSSGLTIGSQMGFNRLIVSNGAAVRSGSGTLGAALGNRLVVTGSGSIWSNATTLFLLNRADVTDGGWLACGDGYLGSSNSVVTLSGASGWNNHGTLRVGDSANGSALIASNGATVLSSNALIGSSASLGNNNLALLTGAGTSWSNRADFTVGSFGAGNQLIVSNGAAMAAGNNFILGANAGANFNAVTLTGNGTLWAVASNVYVGSNNASFCRLVVTNGGTASANQWLIGAGASSTNNRVIVDGGALRATNAGGTGMLEMRHGTNVLRAGLMDVDNLVLTNKGTLTSGGLFGKADTISISFIDIRRFTNLVSGLEGRVTKITVTLSNLTLPQSDAFDFDLTSPAGQTVKLMHGAGGLFPTVNAKLVFDDSSVTPLPTNGIPSGTYHPTANLSSFIGTDPNGAWLLHGESRDPLIDFGKLIGWSLTIQTDAPFHDAGVFEFNGGTLVTRGAVIDNSQPFVVGGPGGVPAIWDARAGLTDNFVARELLVGNNSSFNQLVIPNGVLVANSNVIVGASPVSSNNLLRVTGGTLRVLNPGTLLDVRGGTNRIDAGLVDVLHLVVTNTRGQFEMLGGTLRTPDTIMSNGRVCIIGGGASLATFQMLGGTHGFSNGIVIANNATLTGSGTIVGSLAVSGGGTLSPGDGIGTLVFSNTPNLGGTLLMEVFKIGAMKFNDQIQVAASLFYGGSLIVTNVGVTPFVAGDNFKLFSAPAYGVSFSSLVLPPLSPGLGWMNKLLVDGSIEVVTAPTPGFAGITRSGTNVIVTGTNGTPGANYSVLTATNVALPLTNWVSLFTNQFNAGGNFSFTNAIAPGDAQRYFRIRTPEIAF